MTQQPSLPPPFHLTFLDCIDSTNEEVKRLALGGADHGTVVQAGEQTAGRGRRGRLWVSPRGNLHCSFLLEPGRPLSEAAQLSFVAGLSLAEALTELCPQAEIRCKWPNDLLCNGRKISGMLLETTGIGQGIVLGIGVNILAAPDPALYPTICVRDAGGSADAGEVLAAFCRHFGPWFDRWREGGFPAIRAAWLGHARGLGGEIHVRLENQTLTGIFAGLDDAGALLLDLPNGERRLILAGDVFFPAM